MKSARRAGFGGMVVGTHGIAFSVSQERQSRGSGSGTRTLQRALCIALATVASALAPAGASSDDALGEAALALAPELDERAEPFDATPECTAAFSSGGAKHCTRRWYQTGEVQYTYHQGFHNLLAQEGYSRLYWIDAAGRYVFIHQCEHDLTVEEWGLEECPDPLTSDRYTQGWQTLYLYAEGESCFGGACEAHGRFIVT